MVCLKITKKQRLVATIIISGAFSVAELVVGFRTKSLALIADAFHAEFRDITEVRVWRLGQGTALATARVVVAGDSVRTFQTAAEAIGSCLRLRGIRAVALQPVPASSDREPDWSSDSVQAP